MGFFKKITFLTLFVPCIFLDFLVSAQVQLIAQCQQPPTQKLFGFK